MKRIFILSGKRLLLSACIGVLAVTFAIGLHTRLRQAFPTSAQPKKLPIYCVETEKKQIALTFDAAWENSDTDRLIDILGAHQAKTTFFVTGEWVDKYPQDVKKLYQAGHDIQNHSDKHPHVAKISADKLKSDTLSCDDKVEKLIGKRPTLYRAPYGEYDNEMMTVFESELKHFVIQWDVDSLDWQSKATVDSIYQRVTTKVKNGSIVLFHTDVTHTPEALPKILKELKAQGYEFVLVDDLIYKENYEIKQDGTQCKIKSGE